MSGPTTTPTAHRRKRQSPRSHCACGTLPPPRENIAVAEPIIPGLGLQQGLTTSVATIIECSREERPDLTLFGRLRWRWVGWKVPPFGFAHVGGRELVGFINPAVLPPSLLFPTTLGHKTYQHLSFGPTSTLRVRQHTTVESHPPRCASAFCGFPLSFLGRGRRAFSA